MIRPIFFAFFRRKMLIYKFISILHNDSIYHGLCVLTDKVNYEKSNISPKKLDIPIAYGIMSIKIMHCAY